MLLSSGCLYLKFSQGILVPTLATSPSTFPFSLPAFNLLGYGFFILHYLLWFLHLLPTFQKFVGLSHFFNHSLYCWLKWFLCHYYHFNEVLGGNSICPAHSLESLESVRWSGRRPGLWREEVFPLLIDASALLNLFVQVLFSQQKEGKWKRIKYVDLPSFSSVWSLRTWGPSLWCR